MGFSYLLIFFTVPENSEDLCLKLQGMKHGKTQVRIGLKRYAENRARERKEKGREDEGKDIWLLNTQ